MTLGKAARLAVGVAVALLFLHLILRQVALEDLKQVLAETRIAWVAAAAVALLGGYSCRIERWRRMLKWDNPRLTWHDSAGPLLAGFAVNNVLPFRAGDVLRAFAFTRTLGASAGVVLATLFVERLFDLLVVVLLLGASLIWLRLETIPFSGAGGVILLAISTTLLIVLLYPRLWVPLAHWSGRCAMRLSPTLGRRIDAELKKGMDTLQHLARADTVVRVLGWSLAAWAAEGCTFYFAALALPALTNPHAGWLALPLGTLATLIPSTPGYMGTFDYFTARAMTELGNAAVSATAYALLVHAMLWLPVTVIGGAYALLRSLRRADDAMAT